MKPDAQKGRGTKQQRAGSLNCRAIFAVLSEFLDGTLPARNCRELRRHLKDCRPCIDYLETLRKTVRICQLYSGAPAPSPSPAVREAFREALSKIPPRRRTRTTMRKPHGHTSSQSTQVRSERTTA